MYIAGEADYLYELQNNIGTMPILNNTMIGTHIDKNQAQDFFYDGLIHGMTVLRKSLSADEVSGIHLGDETAIIDKYPDDVLASYGWHDNSFVNKFSADGSECTLHSLVVQGLSDILNECKSEISLNNTEVTGTLVNGVASTIDVQIEPQVPPPRVRDELLLERTEVYRKQGFLPIASYPDEENGYLYVTAMAQGLWRFKFDFTTGKAVPTEKDGTANWIEGLTCKTNPAELQSHLGTPPGQNTSKHWTPTACLHWESVADPSVFVLSTIDLYNHRFVNASTEELLQPYGIAMLHQGTDKGKLLVTDLMAHKIWMIDPQNPEAKIFAGTGMIGNATGPALESTFHGPTTIQVSEDDIVYVTDTYNNQVKKIKKGPDGAWMVSVLSGSSMRGYVDGTDGNTTRFNNPMGMTLSSDEDVLFVADSRNHVVRQINALTGATSTLAGTFQAGFTDGVGPLAAFGSPVDVAKAPWTPEGAELFVADLENDALRRVQVQWAAVRTPVQMIIDAPGADYKSSWQNYSDLNNGCAWQSTLACIDRLDFKPSYGLCSHNDMLIITETSTGSIVILSQSEVTYQEKMRECEEYQKRAIENKHTKRTILAVVVCVIVLIGLIATAAYALHRQFAKKNAKLRAQESRFKKMVDGHLQGYTLDETNTPLDNVLLFLNEFIDGHVPSKDEADKMRKSLIFGKLVNGDVSKPLNLGKSARPINDEDAEENLMISQMVGFNPGLPTTPRGLLRRRSKSRWHKTWNAYHAVDLLRVSSAHSRTPMGVLLKVPEVDGDEESISNTRAFLLASTADFKIDLFQLDEMTQGHCLSTLGKFLFERHGFVKTCNLNNTRLNAFLMRMESLMKDVPYHNRVHVTGVVHAFNFFIMHGGLDEYFEDEFDPFTCLFAALCHDFQHPGVNNDFLVRTQHDLALTYNDESPLENFHISSIVYLMRKHGEFDFMEKISREDKTHVRKMFVDLIMATDMSKHFALVNQARILLSARESKKSFLSREKGSGKRNDDVLSSLLDADTNEGALVINRSEKDLILKIVMKCADLSHTFQAFDMHERWCNCLMEEFNQQGDQEVLEGFSPKGLFNRAHCTPTEIAKSQTAFMDIIAIPLFEVLAQLLPKTAPLLAQIHENRNTWYSKSLLHTSSHSTHSPRSGKSSPLASARSSIESGRHVSRKSSFKASSYGSASSHTYQSD